MAEEVVVEETPTEETEETEEAPTRYLVVERIRYEDDQGNEFFAGPGEVVDAAAAAQVEASAVVAL